MAVPKSFIALSMHKAGSTIANRILGDIAQVRGYELDLVANKAWNSSMTAEEYFISYQPEMKTEGYYYGMVRGAFARKLPVIGSLRAIVQVRDPRDCITSAYFSFGESHRLPDDDEKRAAFLERREKINSVDIDSFAAPRARPYRQRMDVLAQIIDAHDDVLVLKYEEMVLDTEAWLGRISEFLGQPVTDALRARLGEKLDFSVDGEDTSRHKRQVLPGDHRRKLSPETIAAMNADLKDMLVRFDYAV